MAEVVVETEHDEPSGWRFDVLVQSPGGNRVGEARSERHTVLLSWVDYDLWCHGRSRPENVVKAVIEFILDEKLIERLPARFDAAMVRRWRRDADDILSGRL